jgi:hypothetical protein
MIYPEDDAASGWPAGSNGIALRAGAPCNILMKGQGMTDDRARKSLLSLTITLRTAYPQERGADPRPIRERVTGGVMACEADHQRDIP